MKKLILSTLLAGTVASMNAFGAPIGISGNGPIYFQYSNAEQYSFSNSTTYGDGLWGIVQMSIIQQGTALNPIGSDIQGGGNTVFVNGQNSGNQILGIFYNGKTNGIDPTVINGGKLDLYWFDKNTQNVGVEINAAANLLKHTASSQYSGFTNCVGVVGCVGPTLLARFDFASGAHPAGSPDQDVSTVDPTTLDGSAALYLNVDTSVIGAWTTALDTNFFTLNAANQLFSTYGLTPRDVRLDTKFNHNGATAWDVGGTDIVGLRSNDPGRADTVPEPATLALIGLGLLGMGATIRRRQA